MADLVLTATIDATQAAKAVQQLKRDVASQVGGAIAAAFATAGRTSAQAGLQSVGATARAFGPSAGAAGRGTAAAAYRAETAALIRLQNLRSRAERQLGAIGTVTAKAERLTAAHAKALQLYGTAGERTLQLDRARRLELDKVSAGIAKQAGLLTVLKGEAEATRRTIAGIGLKPGGANIVGSGAINLAQSVIASGGSLQALAVGAAVQAPEILQAVTISGGAATVAITALAAAVAVAGPALAAFNRHQRDAANAAAILEGATSQLAAAQRRYGDTLQALPDVERSSLLGTTQAAIEQQLQVVDAARDKLATAMRDAANTSTTVNTPGGQIEIDDGSLEKLIKLREQTQVFRDTLKETNSVAAAFAKSGLDERAFAADAAGVREASDELDRLNRQLDQVQGKAPPDLSIKGLADLRDSVGLLERLSTVADPRQRAAVEVDERARAEAAGLGASGAAAADVVALRRREAAQAAIAARDEADATAKAGASQLQALEREAAIARRIAGIRDADARARSEVALRAADEARAAGMTADQLDRQVSLSLQVFDAKARIAAADERSAAAAADQNGRLDRQLQGILQVAAVKARMASLRDGAEADLGERRQLLEARRGGLALAGAWGDQHALQSQRDRQSLAGRLDVANNPAMQADFDRLLPDVDKLARLESALDSIRDALEATQSPAQRIGAEMHNVSAAFADGTIGVAEYRAGMAALQSQLEAADAQMLKTSEATRAMNGDFGAGFHLALQDVSAGADDTRRFFDEAFGAIGGFAEDTFRGALRGTLDLKEAARQLAEDMAVMIARMLVMKAIAAAIGGPTATPAGQPGAAPAAGGGGFWGTLGTVIGTAVGAYAGGPAGAQAGAQIGGQLGGAVGGSNVGSQPGGPSQRFARGGVLWAGFANDNVRRFADGGLIDRPTAFPTRGGVGLAGDASEPEAIFPLHRDSRGRLGVGGAAPAAAGAPVLNANINVTTTATGNPRADDAAAESAARAMRRQLKQFVSEEMVAHQRAGGVLHRRYG